MTDFRIFADDCKGLVEHLVRLISGDRDIVPMVHYRDASGHVDGMPIDAAWFADGAQDVLVNNLVVPFVQILRPESVAWTFTGRRGWTDGFFEHDVAATCVVDRERAEIWEARLVRHDDGRASLGAWRPWPVDEAGGRLLSPIQRALR